FWSAVAERSGDTALGYHGCFQAFRSIRQAPITECFYGQWEVYLQAASPFFLPLSLAHRPPFSGFISRPIQIEKIGHANGLVSRLSKSGSAGRSSLCCAHSITEALALCLFFTSHFIRSDLLISQGKRQGLAHCWPVKAID
ncbi:MAG TPA: hypothetical protein VF607_04700, partial [Verrucomicrobiae bacterium]